MVNIIPYIISLSRITSHCRTLIDNIFSNNFDNEISSGSKTSAVSDHYLNSS